MRSFRKRRFAALALIVLVAATALAWTALACGPFFPFWLLGGDVMAGPTALFNREVERLLASPPPHASVRPVGVGLEELAADTARAEREDLVAALEKAGVPDARRQEILDGHAAWRRALASADAADAAPPAPPAIPAGLPAEFALYLEGAAAYHRGDAGGAEAAWRNVLDLPAGERHFRSTWAAFMLGRLHDPGDGPGDDAEALGWYRKTRELAAQGFADTLHLAATSLGWEARRADRRGDWAQALRLYAQQQRQGEPTALLSLRFVCRHALAAGDAALVPLAADPEARPIVTAFLLSVTGDEAGWRRHLKAWLAAVRQARVEGAEEASSLAWAAYRAGDYTTAAGWLERAPRDAPMARWIAGRLLLRQGKVAAAAEKFDGLSRDFPDPELSVEDADWLYEAGEPVATRTRAAGEAGVARLRQGRFPAALDRFLAGGYGFDAAYVAERVLSVVELKSYVDILPPPPEARPAGPAEPGEADDETAESGGLRPPEVATQQKSLRELLGRRLARAGRFAEAGAYLPAEQAAPLAAWAAAARPGADPKILFRGACAARRQGMELLGTEIAPDWAYFGGEYEPGFAPQERPPFLAPTAAEKRRAARSGVHPDRRFHYRYVAAQKARQAASRLPDGTKQKAAWIATAGTWLKYRDPEATLPFYRELLRCCGTTELGREARRIHWIPDTDACADTEP